MTGMDDPTGGGSEAPDEPDARRAADAASGDRPGRHPAPLERAPSERYGSATDATAVGSGGRIGRAVAIAVVGAAVIAFLGGPLSMTAGLLAVDVVLALVIGSIARPATALGIALAVGAVAVGLLGVWLFARTEGGVLDPLAYLVEVEGPVAPLQLIVAAVAAFIASR
jgi:hypothetical protein